MQNKKYKVMATKVSVQEYFDDYQSDGNSLSLEKRIEELVLHGFPIELTDLEITVSSKEDLSKVVNDFLETKKGSVL